MSEQGDEISLVKQFKEGDERAFNEIVRTYQERLYYLALKLLGDREDAQDISQEAFVKAYYGLKKFREDSSLYTWLYRIVLNLCMNRRRRDKLVEFVSLDALGEITASKSVNPDKKAEHSELNAAIKEAVDSLPEKQRAIFMLRQYEELSHGEIAEIVGRSVGAVKSNYFQAVKKLQQSLAKFR